MKRGPEAPTYLLPLPLPYFAVQTLPRPTLKPQTALLSTPAPPTPRLQTGTKVPGAWLSPEAGVWHGDSEALSSPFQAPFFPHPFSLSSLSLHSPEAVAVFQASAPGDPLQKHCKPMVDASPLPFSTHPSLNPCPHTAKVLPPRKSTLRSLASSLGDKLRLQDGL